MASASDRYAVPLGGGLWHISKQIAIDKVPIFGHLTKAQQNELTSSIGAYILQNHGSVGLYSKEMIKRSVAKNGPWLKEGADLEFSDKHMQEVLSGPRISRLVKNLACHDDRLRLARRNAGPGAGGNKLPLRRAPPAFRPF